MIYTLTRSSEHKELDTGSINFESVTRAKAVAETITTVRRLAMYQKSAKTSIVTLTDNKNFKIAWQIYSGRWTQLN